MSTGPLDVDPRRVSGEWVRHAPHDSELLGRSAEPAEGRWQRADVVRGLYLAQDRDTAVAEWYRLLAEFGIPPQQRIPHDHHVWQLNLELADLTTTDRLRRVGLWPPRPGRRGWPSYQSVGERLYRGGWRGVIAPSAAMPGGLVVCVFDGGAWPPTGCAPVRRIEMLEVPPPPTGMTT